MYNNNSGGGHHFGNRSGPPHNNQHSNGPQYSGPSRQRIIYDGRRMRKAMVRRTLDYSSNVIRMLEARKDVLSGRPYSLLQPTPDYLLNVRPVLTDLDCPLDPCVPCFPFHV